MHPTALDALDRLAAAPEVWPLEGAAMVRSSEDGLSLPGGLLDDPPFALAVLDPASGTILETNRAADCLLGLVPGSGICFHDLVAEGGHDLLRGLQQIDCYDSAHFAFRLRSPADADYLVHAWACRMKVRGRSLLYCAFMRPAAADGGTADVSRSVWPDNLLPELHRLRQAEQQARTRAVELEAATLELSLADRRKDEFLAQLAHEMRNPLAPIRLWIQRLQESDETSPLVKQASQVLSRQVRHLTRLVEDLLEVSRFVRGTLALRQEPASLGDAIELAVQMVKPLIEERQHKLQLTMEHPPLWVRGDVARLGEVFHNLLDNAAKYTAPGGHIKLTVSEHGQQAVVKVEDDGTGIDPDFAPHLFDLFSRGHQAETVPTVGLGLGLWLVHQVVRAHGGTITAHSPGPGLGSTFEVRLPLAQAPDTREQTPEPQLAQTPQPHSAAASTCRILVVDDERDVAEAMALYLADQGHEVQVATDAVSGLALGEEFQPQFVLLDIGMPGIDGHELARRLRARPWGRQTVLLAVSGYHAEEDRKRSREAGCDDHLVKPVDPDSLLAVLAAYQPGAR